MKKIKSIVLLFLCIILLCCCGKKTEGIEGHLEFVGSWQCEETPLEHSDSYTGYLVWRISEDGSFSMYDAEAGNPGIAGMIQNVSDKELELACNTEDDFDPPVTWESMEETQVVTYEFVNENELRVTYESEEGGSTLVFTKAE